MSIWKRSRRSYVVRVEGFRAQTVPTRRDAETVELDLKRRKALGELYEATPNRLGDELEAWLDRVCATRTLQPRTVEWYERCRAGWRDLDRVRVCDLTRTMVEDRVAARAAVAPKSAADELLVLKQCLTEAVSRGQRVDRAILTIAPVEHKPRRGRALTVEQLYTLASWMPEHSKRLVLLAGQVGARQHFWFQLTDAMLDLERGTMLAPAALAKNGREHLVYLNDVEVGLLREQLMVRAPGTRLVFPTATGKAWTRGHFRTRVWAGAVEAAAREDSVFGRIVDGRLVEPFTFHMLRHSAGSLMALAGMEPAVAAERLGHTDGGALFLKVYRHLYESERRVHADRLGAFVRAQLAEHHEREEQA